jgi:ABC-type nitrate/sulfonate/bicarbonate transport system substrate-binding protein
MHLFRTISAIWLALALASGTQAQDSLRINTFRGATFWPAMVGIDKGFYAKNGAAATLTLTPNSVQQMTGMASGKFDAAFTLIDNVIAYNEGQGEVKLDSLTDLVAVFGLTTLEFSFITVPEVKTLADLRGREISVDALTTGNSYALMEFLSRLGLQPGDYRLVSVGGANLRAKALEEKRQAGTIPPGTDIQRFLSMGYNRLGDSNKVIGRLEGLVGAVSKSWAAANEARVIGLIRGTAQSVEWLQNPANRAEAIGILQKYVPETTQEAAQHAFNVAPREWRRDLSLDMEGVRNIMEIRSRFAQPARELFDPGRYVDTRYHQKALAR